MQVDEALKNLSTFWDIYEFVGKDKKSFDAIKEYLVKDLGKPESTARAHINALRSSTESLFFTDGNYVEIDYDKVFLMLEALNSVWDYEQYDLNYLKVQSLKEEVEGLKSENHGLEKKICDASADYKKLQEQMYEDKICYLKELLHQPVMIKDSQVTPSPYDCYMKKDSYMVTNGEKAKVINPYKQYKWWQIPKGLIAIWCVKHVCMELFQMIFAGMLLEKEIIIAAEVDGKYEKYQLVPIERLEKIEKELNATCGPSDHKSGNWLSTSERGYSNE